MRQTVSITSPTSEHPSTVTVDSAHTVGAINFTSPISYTIGGSSALTMDVNSGQASINVTAGSHTISAPVALNDNLTITSAASTGVALTGNLTATSRSITKAGASSAHFVNVRAANLSVNEGVARTSAKPTPNDPSGTSVVGSLSINPGAQFDLTNNSAVIDYTGPVGSQVNSLRLNLQSGRLTSTSATLATGLGYADNAILGKTSFAGQTVDSDSLLIKFTYFGDSDLDGDVDVADLGNLASSWQTANVWSGGDFDYNGSVDVNDLGLLASNWQAGVGSPLGPDLNTALANLGLPSMAVPEPAGVVAAGMMGMLMLRRRRGWIG
jgi:hypothetical protein